MDLRDVFGAERCLRCGSFGGALCDGCLVRLTPASPAGSVEGVDRVIAGFAYEGVARSLVLGLKLRHRRGHGAALAEGMARAVRRRGILGSVITWVPGRRWDVLDRGFDHAAVLARGVAVRLGLPRRGLLLRSGHRSDQAALGRAERFSNLEGAFRSRPVSGAVILVDDLVTTGATAGACARALLEAGATSVEVLAACRAGPPRVATGGYGGGP
jgi:predicted amidophosphoribosyltransferase